MVMRETSKVISPYSFIILLFFSLALTSIHEGQSQEIDILLKGGHVIDAKNHIDAKMDVAIADGKILEVAPNISAENAKQVVNATGLYVSPGLIDPHTHVFVGSNSGFADGFSSLKLH